MNPALPVSALALLSCSAALRAQDAAPVGLAALALSAFTLTPAQATPAGENATDPQTGESAPEPSVADANLSLRAEPAWGDRGSWSFNITGGVAFSTDATDYKGDLSLGVFAADDFEFRFGLAGWGFNQDGDDAAGVNPNIAFRWHFVNDRPAKRYSVYLDAGIGVLLSDNDVPFDGTDVNFTPRAGVGATFRLGDSNNRLDLGVAWQHVSNGSFAGSDDNPSRDSVMIYAGFTIPF